MQNSGKNLYLHFRGKWVNQSTTLAAGLENILTEKNLKKKKKKGNLLHLISTLEYKLESVLPSERNAPCKTK